MGVCNYPANRDNYPVNGVSWDEAMIYAAWVGARLPSESQWEYAATGRGQNIRYPWGNEDPTCDHGNFRFDGEAVTARNIRQWCDEDYANGPVCSYPLGNTVDGLCDFVGTVAHEFVLDEWSNNLAGTPGDGSPYGEQHLGTQDIHVVRGSYRGSPPEIRRRWNHPTWLGWWWISFRLARDAAPQPE